jgi:hypothetical protein
MYGLDFIFFIEKDSMISSWFLLSALIFVFLKKNEEYRCYQG